ncbi:MULTISPECIES: 4Fe-4S binding protein [unclassified Pseudodesulfovibrio]|uniref:4Fe-4S binding protein n=1 Tax=unclassified Pseudodesulfovibrio TaxID=2661612 RepID=UPI000FEB6D6E|nr:MULTISPECIES: 4Fe-4S binding protein [unclassified Pseudodesulfovibrio]MCJ2165034.1 4Fe-4S binding protein [Pseudodesulfovibrio sp. S3-i]RWU03524.1 4Fe-4S ferredoxin [Pseudodesulfovibrio sp. S3]
MKIPFLKQSTIDYYRASREKGMSLFDFIHGYVYGRWCFHYIGLAGDKEPWWRYLWVPFIALINCHRPFRATPENQTGDPNQKKVTWGDAYHGKPLPLNEAVKLVKLDRPVNTEVSEHVLPYTRAREIILSNPEKIILLDCPCRAGMKNPCTPTDVCLLVGDPFATFMLEHHPTKTRPISADEAVNIIKAEQTRGHVSHAFFKDVMLGRFYAICNCCSCCCGAMKAHAMGIQMLCSSGYLAEVDEEKCVKCGICAEKCQFKAIGFNRNSAFVREDRCMGCGVCTLSCAKEALTLRLAPEKGEPLLVDKL